MDYIAEIEESERKTDELRRRFIKIHEAVSKLKVGDTIYEEGTHGGFDMEYYPQVILEINYDDAKIFVHEEGIGVKKWRSSFTLFENGKVVNYY